MDGLSLFCFRFDVGGSRLRLGSDGGWLGILGFLLGDERDGFTVQKVFYGYVKDVLLADFKEEAHQRVFGSEVRAHLPTDGIATGCVAIIDFDLQGKEPGDNGLVNLNRIF